MVSDSGNKILFIVPYFTIQILFLTDVINKKDHENKLTLDLYTGARWLGGGGTDSLSMVTNC